MVMLAAGRVETGLKTVVSGAAFTVVTAFVVILYVVVERGTPV